jgi:hypothetical protein
MWLKLTILYESDFDAEIYGFENIGIIGKLWEGFKNKKEGYVKVLDGKKLNYDICLLLPLVGYDYIPNEEIMKYKNIPIKRLVSYNKNSANEMYFTKFLIKL